MRILIPVAVLVLFAALGAVMYFKDRPGPALGEEADSGPATKAVGDQALTKGSDQALPGPAAADQDENVEKPHKTGEVTAQSDSTAAAPAAAPAEDPAAELDTPRRIPADLNPQVASVAAALRDGGHPERLSPNFVPAAFDAEAWQNDPEYKAHYLQTIEPGRVWQSLQPGPGVPEIERLSPGFAKLAADGRIRLRVGGVPAGAPVTFNSFDSGVFAATQLATESTVASAAGTADVEFIVTQGTVGRTRILAASPAAAGQATFHLQIEDPALADHAPATETIK